MDLPHYSSYTHRMYLCSIKQGWLQCKVYKFQGCEMSKILIARFFAIAVVMCSAFGIAQAINEDDSFQSDPIEPRQYIISGNVIGYGARSEWEGVWGQVSQCDALDKIGWCYKQSALQIYDCYQMQKYRYEDERAECKLGLVMTQIPDPANPTEDQICDSSFFPGEVGIIINGNQAKPNKKYFDIVCGHTSGIERNKCEKNMQFSLSKDTRGISFHSSKGLDSATCETPSDERKAGSLSAIYPRFKGSFDCDKDGLSKVEIGICNSFYTLRDDYSLNIMFEYAMNFAWNNEQKATLKTQQLEWLKQRNTQCNKAEKGEELFKCLSRETDNRIKELSNVIELSQKLTLELVSPVNAVKIYENPSLRSRVLYTKILDNSDKINAQKDYNAMLLEQKSHNGFTKIMLMEFSNNPNENAIIGYVQDANVKRTKK